MGWSATPQANMEAKRVARAMGGDPDEWRLHSEGRNRCFAARSFAHARNRGHVYQLRLDQQNRRRIRKLLAQLVQTRRMEEVTAALDVLFLGVSTAEIGSELVQLAESDQLDTTALARAVDQIMFDGGVPRPRHGPYEMDFGTELARALQQLVSQEVETGVVRHGGRYHCHSLYERVVFLDMCADGGGITWWDRAQWVLTLQERGWLTAPDAEPNSDPRAYEVDHYYRWRFTELGHSEWAKMRKTIARM